MPTIFPRFLQTGQFTIHITFTQLRDRIIEVCAEDYGYHI